MKLTAPSKTFLIGEYAVLAGGCSLIATTEPSFSLSIEKDSAASTNNIHQDSPAGKLLQDHLQHWQQQSLNFSDPHQGSGGFGASSAQFLLCYRYLFQQHRFDQPALADLLSHYLRYAYDGRGIAPSGADLIAQAVGQGIVFQQNDHVDSLQWPFADVDYFLIHTGNKLATHVHLQHLANHDFSSLVLLCQQSKQAWDRADAQAFAQLINDYYLQLQQLALVAEHTQQLCQQLKQHCSVLAVKGCGAMGADVLFVMAETHQQSAILDFCQQHGLAHHI